MDQPTNKPDRRISLCLAAMTALLLFATQKADADESKSTVDRPNVVFLFADDLGYGDLACYGAPDVETPNLDRLARQGVRFTQHYSNGPECSPTRTALMTGRYQQHVGGLECAIGTGDVGRYDDAIRLAEQHDLGLPSEWAILPRAMRGAGYETVCFGKWHLGYQPKFNPHDAGFEKFFGCLGGYVDYFTHRELSPLDVLYADRRPIEREGYMTHLLAEQALSFLDKEHDRPFLLYVPFTSPHFPFQSPDDRKRETTADNLTKGTREEYVELVEDLDRQVGRILKRIDSQGLAENTVVVFASDNGAMAPGRNLPLSGFKGTVEEGGIRVPLIARWPGKLSAGETCEQPCLTFDLTASFLAIAGAKAPKSRPLEGIDILSHAAEGRDDVQRTLFWRGRRGERTERAVRHGDLKYLHRRLDDGDVIEGLYDLAQDPAESNNLMKQRGEDLARLRQLLADWERDVKADR
ncbi:MAG: sulfatase-like hydrolase/transferase [Pirellulaceae bacterium]